MAEGENSDILPEQDAPGTKQGASYGYPGVRSGGQAVIKQEPTVRVNGKLAGHNR